MSSKTDKQIRRAVRRNTVKIEKDFLVNNYQEICESAIKGMAGYALWKRIVVAFKIVFSFRKVIK